MVIKLKNTKVCLDESKNISDQDFKDIALKWNIKTLSKYIKDDCKNDGNIITTDLQNYIVLFNEHYNKSKQKSEEKTQKIYDISKVWLYSDWLLA